MPNPFKQLKEQVENRKAAEEPWVETEGAMSCQTRDCYEIVNEGKYFPNLRLATWQCSQGHISRMENVD